jgi:hypothetical protein
MLDKDGDVLNVAHSRCKVIVNTREKLSEFLGFLARKYRESATVNHQVGGSSPSRGAIQILRLTTHRPTQRTDQEIISHRAWPAMP